MTQKTLMAFDPATGRSRPYPSEAAQWRKYHGGMAAWLFNPWTGRRRNSTYVGSDIQGVLIAPLQENEWKPSTEDSETVGCFISLDVRYQSLLDALGVQGHTGALAEIARLRATASLKN